MKLLIAVAVLLLYMLFAPSLFVEFMMMLYPLKEMEVLFFKFIVMIGGAIAFGAFTPIEWFKNLRWRK